MIQIRNEQLYIYQEHTHNSCFSRAAMLHCQKYHYDLLLLTHEIHRYQKIPILLQHSVETNTWKWSVQVTLWH